MDRLIESFLESLKSAQADEQRDYSVSTRQSYAIDLGRFYQFLLRQFQAAPQPGDFSDENVLAFLLGEEHAGFRQSTVLRRRSSLRQFGRYLDERGLLPGPLHLLEDEGFARPQAAPPVRRLACLTPPQVQALLAVAQHARPPRAYRDNAILSLLLETGLNVQRLVHLNLSDISFEHSQVRLSQRRSELWLPLGPALPALRQYLEQGRADLGVPPGEQALFVSQQGYRLSRQGIWQILRHWGKQAGLDLDLSPRLLRHTAAMQLLHQERPLHEIQYLLGHRNPLSTQALLRRLRAAELLEPVVV